MDYQKWLSDGFGTRRFPGRYFITGSPAISQAHLISHDLRQAVNDHPFLLQRIAVTNGYRIVFQGIVVNGNAEGCADGILPAVTLADGILFLVLAVEIEFHPVHDLTGFFGKSVFFGQRQYGQLNRCQGRGDFQYHAFFLGTAFPFHLFFGIGIGKTVKNMRSSPMEVSIT